MSSDKTIRLSGVAGTGENARQESPLAERIAAYLEKSCVVSEICEEWRGSEHCHLCGFLEADHLLRDAHRALTLLAAIRIDEEPVSVRDDLTVTIHAPHNHD
jgi:hypothetical protein